MMISGLNYFAKFAKYKSKTIFKLYKNVPMRPFPHMSVACMVLFLAAMIMPLSAQDKKSLKFSTVVIDPGHGGKDAGCISRDKKTLEKNLTLDISRRLAEKIRRTYPDIKVIMTRSSDKYIPLNERADIANRNSADLFISIHINAQDGGTSANGYSIHCLGQSSRKGNDLFSKNLELTKRENSVILLEDDYSTKYQGFDPNDPESYIFFNLMQNANLGQSLVFAEDVNGAMGSSPIKRSRGVSQDPFLVLWRTTMPAVLVECGFMSNPSDLAALRSADGRDRIASNILKAFGTFKDRYDGSLDVSRPAGSGESAEENEPEPETLYGTQISASAKLLSEKDPFFKGYRPMIVKTGKLNKYVVGVSGDRDKARVEFYEIRKKFPDSFLVKIENGKITVER